MRRAKYRLPLETIKEVVTEEQSDGITMSEDPELVKNVSNTAVIETEQGSGTEPIVEENDVSQVTEEKTTDQMSGEIPQTVIAEESTAEQMAEGSTAPEKDAAGIQFANQFKQRLKDAGYDESNVESIVQINTNSVTLVIASEDSRILALLSQQSQTAEENYQNWNIKFTVTGNLILLDDFRGLGDEGFPYTVPTQRAD